MICFIANPIQVTDMFQQLIKKLHLSSNEREPENSSVERLTALLLVEIARSDTAIDDVELDSIRQALKTSSVSMAEDEVDELIEAAIKDADAAISLHTQLRQINSQFTREQKLLLIKQMWVVALADGDLDKYEEHMIRKLSGLLHVGHDEFIQAKLKVIDG